MEKHKELENEIEEKKSEIQACNEAIRKLGSRRSDAYTELHELEARQRDLCGLAAMGRADPADVVEIRERLQNLQTEMQENSLGSEWLIALKKRLTDEVAKAKLVGAPRFRSLLEQYEKAKPEYAKAYAKHTKYQASKRMDDQTVRRRKKAKADVTGRREHLISLAHRAGKEKDLAAFLASVEAEA